MSFADRNTAAERVRFGGPQCQQAGQIAATRALTDLEQAEIEAEQQRWRIQHNRREALATVVALGRRYDSASDAIDDAREIAAFLKLEID